MTDGVPTLVTVASDGIRALEVTAGTPAPALQQLLGDGTSVTTLCPAGPVMAAEHVRWLPPLSPGKVCCVAINNRAFDEARISGPDHPAFFLKSPTSLIGHREPILLDPSYGLTHPEPELAVVIGSTASRVTEDEALQHVFGYTILNDVTSVGMRNEDYFHFLFDLPGADGIARRVEQHTSYAGRYKGADTFGPLGPVVVTADEIHNPDDLTVRCWLNDELVQSDRTSSYRYPVAQVVSFISQFVTLLPGDVVSLGTAVSNAGADTRPLASLDMRTGVDTVTIEIERIGQLTNPVRWRPPHAL